MGSHFERQSADGNYKVVVATRNDYSDGAIRVQPPIQTTTEEMNNYVSEEFGVKIWSLISGQEATVILFSTPDDGDEISGNVYRYIGPSISREQRLRYASDNLVGFLNQIENEAQFIELNT